MKALLSVRSAIAAAPALPQASAVAHQGGLPAVVARLRVWGPLTAIMAGALFLRLYRLEGAITYYPDSYAQLGAIEHALSGTFPFVVLYPPGVALFLSPVFALLPDTLATMQAAILATGVGLVVLAYLGGLWTTNDRRAAVLFTGAVAFSATFVFYSRVALFDVINTFLIALSLFLAPLVVRRGLPALLAYALLVFVTITIRYTNPMILPALFLASLDAGHQPLSARRIIDHLRSRSVLVVGSVVGALSVAYFALSFEALSRFGNSESGDIFEFTTYLSRVGQYARASLIGYGDEFRWSDGITAAGVLAFAGIGARRLWQTNRTLMLPIAVLILLWCPVHAVYNGFWDRYAMPAFFFVLLLATFGVSISLTWWRSLQLPWQRVAASGLLALAVTSFAAQQLAQDAAFLVRWPEEVDDSREYAYADVRDFLRGLDGSTAVLLSSQAMAVDTANPELETYDLFLHSTRYGINDRSLARLLAYVREQQAVGKAVYYHYTEFEDVRSHLRKYELSFYDYFATLGREFSAEPVVTYASQTRTQRIYLMEPDAAAR